MNDEQKEAFLQLPLNEQLLAIIDGQSFIRKKLEELEKRQENFEADTRLYRRLREVNDVTSIERIVDKIINAIKMENTSG